jgi:hypothetical protein
MPVARAQSVRIAAGSASLPAGSVRASKKTKSFPEPHSFQKARPRAAARAAAAPSPRTTLTAVP